MDLFSATTPKTGQPLSDKLRPQKITEFVGQEKILNQNSPLMKMIERGVLPNLIIWGPPGSGKTSFALYLSQKLDFKFILANAINTGAKKIRELGEAAHNDKIMTGKQTVLFIDEIHRLNKSQQDVLLPFTEKGDLILIGATTENPSYELNSALLSRSKLLVFDRLNEENLSQLLLSCLQSFSLSEASIFTSAVKTEIISESNGDARKLYNILDQIIDLYNSKDKEGLSWPLNIEAYLEFFQSTSFYYDKKGCGHYNTTSAFIKSIRGSDPDAAVYYLARMIKGGEDPVFIARRLVILASEDVGNADPRALQLAIAGLEAVKAIGLPEAGINLAQVTTYLSSAPKSNRSYLAYKEALAEVESSGNLNVPNSLKSARTKMAKDLGFGKDYKYSHDGEKSWVKQNFLPKELSGRKFYEPSEIGFEKNITAYLKWLKS